MARTAQRLDTKRLAAIVGGSAGNLVEWYDWYAYTALSLYFSAAFFPAGDATAQLLGTSAVFAVGFLMRPIGAYVMGRYADDRGRKAGLALSVALMCAGSLMIAFVPSYATIGLAAPVTLVVARMIQGLSVGGEYGASATYLSEMATRRHRGFWSSFQYVTLIGGQLTALGVTLLLQAVLDADQMTDFGWRIAFVLGAVLALGVYLLRRRLAETAAFEALPPDRPKSSALALWRDNRRAFVLVTLVSAGGSLGFYAYTTYMQKFLANTAGFPVQVATGIMTAALLVFMAVQPLFGWISDRIGRKPLLLLFGAGGTIVSVPIFHAIAGARSAGEAFALVLVPLLLLAAYTAISAVIKAELFPASVRALGVALPYAIGNALFGGTAEYVALRFKQAGVEAGFYWYVAAVLAVSTVCFWVLPDTGRTSRIVED